MKTKNLIVAILAIFIMSACDKDNDTTINSPEGTYVGTISVENDLKSSFSAIKSGFDAQAIVTKINNEQIRVHCFGNDFDTTITLNYFEHHDSIMVCLTGADFEHMYGHQYGEGHMSGGMMDDRQNGETEWMHHMRDEHQEGDEHFGGFDMMNHSFNYMFKLPNHNYHFQGIKE